jgi:hypothetical protein
VSTGSDCVLAITSLIQRTQHTKVNLCWTPFFDTPTSSCVAGLPSVPCLARTHSHPALWCKGDNRCDPSRACTASFQTGAIRDQSNLHQSGMHSLMQLTIDALTSAYLHDDQKRLPIHITAKTNAPPKQLLQSSQTQAWYRCNMSEGPLNAEIRVLMFLTLIIFYSHLTSIHS